jgi:hypothetical protein
MTTMAWTYAIYLTICTSVTIWVARTLGSHAPAFLVDSNGERSELANAMTRLLIVGFYLVNLGVISLALKYGDPARDITSAMELLSTKVGAILISIGLVHFIVLAKLGSMRRVFSWESSARRQSVNRRKPQADGEFVDLEET